MADRLVSAALFGLLVAATSYAARFLTLGGSVAAFALALVIYGFGGWAWAVPMVTFFIFSGLLSKYGRARKKQFDEVFEKSSTRDAGQVLANGGVAGILALLAGLLPLYDFYPIYLGSVAAATADTWGTEIGVMTKGETRSTLTFKQVEPGTSGGISKAGTIAGLLGASLISFSGYPWYTEIRTGLIIILGGIAGSLADSVMGATVQAQYRCSSCGKSTEKKAHCGSPTVLTSGARWISNDVVNGCCALTGALVSWGLELIL